MAKFKSRDTLAFIALFTVIAYATVPVQTNTIEHNKRASMADNWVLIHQRNRGRGNPQRGGERGGPGGRPLNPGHGLQPPGLPIANTISVAHGVSSSSDITLNTFLEVLIFAFHCITVVLAHVKHVGCGFISKLKLIILRLSESKLNLQPHNIHHRRLCRAVTIILILIFTNTTISTNINSLDNKLIDSTQPTLAPIIPDPQHAVSKNNRAANNGTILNTKNSLTAHSHYNNQIKNLRCSPSDAQNVHPAYPHIIKRKLRCFFPISPIS